MNKPNEEVLNTPSAGEDDSSLGSLQCRHCHGTGLRHDFRIEGEKCRQARLKKGISAREMAKLIGCSASYICDLEMGRRSWGGKIAHLYKSKL